MPRKRWYILGWAASVLLLTLAVYRVSPEKAGAALLVGGFILCGGWGAIYYSVASIRRTRAAADPDNRELDYYSPRCVQDCASLLSRKNVRDTLLFDCVQESESRLYLTFLGEVPAGAGRFETRYAVELEPDGEGCCLRLSFLSEKLLMTWPLIPGWWIDDFMTQKLNAKRLTKVHR